MPMIFEELCLCKILFTDTVFIVGRVATYYKFGCESMTLRVRLAGPVARFRIPSLCLRQQCAWCVLGNADWSIKLTERQLEREEEKEDAEVSWGMYFVNPGNGQSYNDFRGSAANQYFFETK